MGNKNDQVFGCGFVMMVSCVFLLMFSTCILGGQDIEQVDLPRLQWKSFRVPENLTVRVRLKSITPAEPTSIQWRHGGEGQGGDVIHCVFPKVGVPASASVESHKLSARQWSAPVSVASMTE